jgi:hypothetical protein
MTGVDLRAHAHDHMRTQHTHDHRLRVTYRECRYLSALAICAPNDVNSSKSNMLPGGACVIFHMQAHADTSAQAHTHHTHPRLSRRAAMSLLSVCMKYSMYMYTRCSSCRAPRYRTTFGCEKLHDDVVRHARPHTRPRHQHAAPPVEFDLTPQRLALGLVGELQIPQLHTHHTHTHT